MPKDARQVSMPDTQYGETLVRRVSLLRFVRFSIQV